MALSKTNAVRAVERLKVPFELRTYEVDPEDLAAESVALKIGFPVAQVYKTLVVRGERTGVVLAVVAGDAELDLKALAKVTGNKSVAPVPLREVEPLTGYIRGGVTAFACKKSYPVFVDSSALLHPTISISGGMRGLQILLGPADYVRGTNAQVGDIARPKA